VGISHDEQAEHDEAEFHDPSDLCARKERSIHSAGRFGAQRVLRVPPHS